MKTEYTYLINQTLTIAALFASGFLFLRMLEEITLYARKRGGEKVKRGRKKSITRGLWRISLAFPTGLALWCVMGFFLLVMGIPYGRSTMGLCYGILFSALCYYYIDTRREFTPDMRRIRNFVITMGIVLAVAFVCCSGIMAVSVSNDSYYYYSLYPQTIVLDGGYSRSYDVFLTDVGQMSAIIGTLPWLFGFENTFGIQLFTAMNLVSFFGLSVFEMAYPYMPGKAEIGISRKKMTSLVSVLSALMLMAATPFYVMSRWVLSNIYFMTFFFILFILTILLTGEEYLFMQRDRILTALFITVLSMLRMEGGMMAGLLILCACSLKLESSFLQRFYAMPVLITEAIYYAAIYIRLQVDPLYSFLGLGNVIVMLLFMGALIFYLKYIRGKKLLAIQRHYTWFLLLAMLAGNGVLALISTDRYIGNLRFFWLNILRQNGWGEFAVFIPLTLLLLPVGVDLKKEIEFPVLFTLGYLLFTVALCWARDGTLRVGIGDSGNRVLMQIVPFVLYTITGLLIEKKKREE